MKTLKRPASDPPTRISWNPLRISGTALPPNLLLMAKIIVIVFVLSGQVAALHGPFLSFVPGLDQLGSAFPVGTTFQLAVAVSAGALFFNRYVRTACLIIGAVILFSILSSRMYFQNNRFYAGLILFIVGLYHEDLGSRLVRVQVLLMYLAAALNKLIEPDWRNGQFFATWAAVSPYQHFYNSVAAHFPGGLLYSLMGWSVICVEFVIVVAFAIPRLRPFAIWLAVGYHTSLLVVAGRTFGVFWFSLLASYLAFVDWPPARATVSVPITREWHRVGELLRGIDLERGLVWTSAAVKALQLRIEAQDRRGWHALLYVLLLNPITYLVAAAALAPLPEHRVRYAGLIVLGVLAVMAADFVGGSALPRLQEVARQSPSAAFGASRESSLFRP